MLTGFNEKKEIDENLFHLWNCTDLKGPRLICSPSSFEVLNPIL